MNDLNTENSGGHTRSGGEGQAWLLGLHSFNGAVLPASLWISFRRHLLLQPRKLRHKLVKSAGQVPPPEGSRDVDPANLPPHSAWRQG